MSTTAVRAGLIMDRAARLLNDPNRTDYTYAVMLPFLNMAVEEFSDSASEANTPFSNLSNLNYNGVPIIIPIGSSALVSPEDAVSNPQLTSYPDDLIEVQEIGEREVGNTTGAFRPLPRREFQTRYTATNSLLYWVWERGVIRFNPNGASVPLEVQLKYIYQGVPYMNSENDVIVFTGSRTYLAYKTASYCAMFIGENPERAGLLDAKAQEALERTLNIASKGRQQIMTRHRPFRAAWKARGGF